MERRTFKTTIVTPQIPQLYLTGGIGTFVGHFVRLLISMGDAVTVIYTEPSHQYRAPKKGQRSEKDRLREWRDLGVEVIQIQPEPLKPSSGNYPITLEVAERANSAIPKNTDIVYFADWKANGLYTVKQRKFSREVSGPQIVTILHGSSCWDREGQGQWSRGLEEIRVEFNERYVVEHSDFVLAPSTYALEWARQQGWQLPAGDRTLALNYPFYPPDRTIVEKSESIAVFERLVFYGRLDTRKGIDLFVDALLTLEGESCLRSIKEIVLLGGEGRNKYGSAQKICGLLRASLRRIRVTAITEFNSEEAQEYLALRARGSLVVVPSRSETLGFAIIEATLIDGLNIICSNAGGIPEIFGADDTAQLFDPSPASLVRKLRNWLEQGPLPAEELGHYDWQAANARWISFHERLRQTIASQGSDSFATKEPETSPEHSSTTKLDVCITYYNLGKYLPYLLESLARQTWQHFNVFIVNDGSTDKGSIEIFQQMENMYAKLEWKFINTENQGVSAARNYAASLGSAEYICFVDADNVASPNMIQRFLESIEKSQDDLLTCHEYVFEGEGSPYVSGVPVPAAFSYAPIGNCPEAIFIHNPFGDLNSIMRRSVFEAVGGFTLDYDKYVNCEDLELFARISLSGYKVDVIPEYLFFYRLRSDSRLHTTEQYRNEGRFLRVYEDRLRQVGLQGLIPVAMGLQKTIEQNAFFDINRLNFLQEHAQNLEAQLEAVQQRAERTQTWGEGQQEHAQNLQVRLEAVQQHAERTQTWGEGLQEHAQNLEQWVHDLEAQLHDARHKLDAP